MDSSSSSSSSGMEEGSVGSDHEGGFDYDLGQVGSPDDYDDDNDEDDDDDMDEEDDEQDYEYDDPMEDVVHNFRLFGREHRIDHVVADLNPSFGFADDAALRDMLRGTAQGLVRSGSMNQLPRSIHFERMDPDNHSDEPLRILLSRFREHPWQTRSHFRRSEHVVIHPSLRRQPASHQHPAEIEEIASNRANDVVDGRTSSSVLRSIARLQSVASEESLQDDGSLTQYTQQQRDLPPNLGELTSSASQPFMSATPVGFFSRNRHMDRFAHRDRERDRIPAALLRRWTYHPAAEGGDILHAMFDTISPWRRAPKDYDGKPMIIPETHSSVEAIAEQVTNDVSYMLSEIRSVDELVRKAEKTVEQFKKKMERKEAEGSKTGEDAANSSHSKEERKVEIRDDDETGININANEHVEAVPSANDASQAPAGREEHDESGVGLQQAVARSAPGLGNAQEEISRPDLVMDSIEVSQRRNAGSLPSREEERRETDPTRLPSESVPPVNPLSADGSVQPSDGSREPENHSEGVDGPANNISEVAAQRAAAAGISLHAPANVNPDVVAAATESTGIDPAFLAALPEDIRTEVLTQYYDSIRTNTNAQSGQSSTGATNINRDFLVALPPALRAEVLEMEADFQSRQEARNTTGNNNNDSGDRQNAQIAPAEMDNATFLATLPNELREEVLLTSGEEFIQSLPPNVAAEARILREREMNNRMSWRVNGQDIASLGIERRAPGILRSGSGGRRERGRRNLVPTMQWKKTDSGWIRDLQDSENEPEPFLDVNGIASLVNLLWMRHPEFGRQQIYQVLLYACKTTITRKLVLEELIRLVTSNDIGSPKADSSLPAQVRDIEYTKRHGTAVRRGLEIMSLICRNDVIVSEFLLGLPKSEEDFKSPNSLNGLGVTQARASLSTLMSLMHTTLFKRSDFHMDQLMNLISSICHAIPPVKSTDSGHPKGRRGRRAAPVLLEQSGISDPVRLLMFDIDEDEVFPMLVEEDEEEVDSFEELIMRSRGQGRLPVPSGRDNPSDRDKDKDKKKNNKEEEVLIPPQYRVPRLKESELIALTKVLLRSSCVDRTHDRTSRSIGQLGQLLENRKVLMSSLVAIAKQAGEEIEKEYVGAIRDLETCTEEKGGLRKKQVLSDFSLGSTACDTTLLRVVKSMSTLLKHEDQMTKQEVMNHRTDENLKVEGAVTGKGAYRRSMSKGLQDVWSALDKLLDMVADETKLTGQKTGKKKSIATPSVAEMLGPQRKHAHTAALSPLLSRLSSVIEAFIVMHTVEGSEVAATQVVPPQSPLEFSQGSSRSPSWKGSNADSDNEHITKLVEDELALFVERHRIPINILLRSNPALLETSFKGTLRHPHAIDFDNKKAYFRNMIKKRSSESHAGTIKVSVRRERVLEESYIQLRMRTAEEMKGRLHVQFHGEEGVDAGGVTREWYIILARQIFDPNYVLFTRSAAKAATYQPDKRSYINKEHLETFRFVGRVIAKAIYDGQLIDAYFTRSFYKHILGMKPNFHDIEGQDPDYYKSLKWILENDCTGIIDYTMSAEYDEFGKQTVIDLIPNGRNIPVTEENKAEYVRHVTEVRMTKAIEKQIEAFKEGFYEIIPLEDCRIFNEVELELLMSGLPDIDMGDLKANVEYTGYTASSPQINWFWRCVSKMDQEDLARLVMFVTGTSKVPLEGFSQLQGMNGVQKFQIHRVSGNTMRLPSAHTCFNQLDLPEYNSADLLSERLLRAIRECSVGFGFA
ncbi:E3 ubiquitin-protein ligase UPL1 [Gracilariopsis chorda]|uniref:HECT-type E3 ubiquitin transferase n=1 Tax=Gracilariopsis chorda TaxID=448386 RepID=A0A2V3IPL0_9FLOR|nr:E3 ubiquitin-protein ligase UPL1 [Gracilariopsis chorda]|eukprot:PXF44012.1 E3 ubiquitin-protein ligase UPL1 [Gracilariopsis chorda]